jgi:homoserine kinase
MARSILSPDVPLKLAVEHSRRVAAFVAGCATDDLDLVRAGLQDLLVEPQRVHLLPVLPELKAAALKAGALGCSFSGSGPSVFVWVEDAFADDVERAMASSFKEAGMNADVYRAPIASRGVKVWRTGEELVAA